MNTMSQDNRFVKSVIDTKTPDGFLVEKNEVGVMGSVKNNIAKVFFIRPWREILLPLDKLESFDLAKTGDAFEQKICNICHRLLDTSNFAKNQNGKNNRSVRRPSCNDCRKLIDGTNISNKEKQDWMKKRPKNEPFECPICNKRTIAGVTSKIVLDHDHKTGKIRGWVCDSCNTGIGRFKDDVGLIQRAIKFLE